MTATDEGTYTGTQQFEIVEFWEDRHNHDKCDEIIYALNRFCLNNRAWPEDLYAHVEFAGWDALLYLRSESTAEWESFEDVQAAGRGYSQIIADISRAAQAQAHTYRKRLRYLRISRVHWFNNNLLVISFSPYEHL